MIVYLTLMNFGKDRNCIPKIKSDDDQLKCNEKLEIEDG